MGIEKNPLGKPCAGCFFLGRNLGNCDYWLIMDKLRPCKPGKECTVKTKEAPPEWIDSGRAIWDTKLGKHLYDQGATDAEIAKACHVSIAAVASYRKRNWGKVKHKEGEKTGGRTCTWDCEKGLEMYRAGANDAEIARALGISANTVTSYRKRNWGKSNINVKANWDVEEGLRLRKEGKTYQEIADRLGVTLRAVAAYAKRHWRGEG